MGLCPVADTSITETMYPETRQTLIGVVGMTVTEIVALAEGFNGMVLTAYLVAVVALVAPEAVDKLPYARGGE